MRSCVLYFPREVVELISPEVTHFIKLRHDEEDEGDGELPLEIFLEPLKLHEKNFVFLAINDQSDSSSAGGSHWSLLLYSR